MNIPARTSNASLPAERLVTRAFEDAGAVSPATARPLEEIPGVGAAVIMPLAARGVVRITEGGRYYLFAGTEHARRKRIVTVAAVLAVMVLFAVFMQLFSVH